MITINTNDKLLNKLRLDDIAAISKAIYMHEFHNVHFRSIIRHEQGYFLKIDLNDQEEWDCTNLGMRVIPEENLTPDMIRDAILMRASHYNDCLEEQIPSIYDMKDLIEENIDQLTGKGPQQLIVATPDENYLNSFTNANQGSNDILLVQMAIQYGMLKAFKYLLAEIDQTYGNE